MVFASSIFLYYFLPIFLGLYYLSPKRVKSYTIAVASYVFYGWWRPDFVILMWVSTVVDFSCGRRITAARARGDSGKPWVLVSLVVNLGLLGYFKYANFGIDTLNAMLAGFDQAPWEFAEVILPVGISFYTFQTLSYTIDVYRGQALPVKSFRDFMCYVAMFPQLVAGPIVRYNSIAEQLHERTHTLGKFYRGVLAFQIGLAKKVLIADVLADVANTAFAAHAPTTAESWVGALAYTFQIYFDFSGYSDMAIGLGLMMGFRFPINFDQPYRSISITDFWRRWHISLSSFLRDYLYVPLGGNQKGPVRTYINLALTMLLGGLWHGAAWTFVAWGAYQGFWLVVERLAGKRPLYWGLPRPFQMALTFVLAIFGWVLFRSDDIGSALDFMTTMLGFSDSGAGIIHMYLRPMQLLAAAAACLIIWGAPTTQQILPRASTRFVLALQPAFLLALLQLHYVDNVPFLYFQF